MALPVIRTVTESVEFLKFRLHDGYHKEVKSVW